MARTPTSPPPARSRCSSRSWAEARPRDLHTGRHRRADGRHCADLGAAGADYPGRVMNGESLYPRLEPLLAQVQKPIQYVGGELNAQVKAWDDVAVHWALMYPDAYEVGLPNQGLMILYEVLNERPDALAERTYAVWPDLAALMREHGVGQFTVDSHRAVADFDLLGVSFATELGYTNLLEALDLAGVPLDRKSTRLNSSHANISYAVFCLKKKKN